MFKKLLYVLINVINDEQVPMLKNLIDLWYKQNKIDEKDYIFYKALLNLYSLNTDSFEKNIFYLSGDYKYKDLVSQFEQNYSLYNQYRDVPKYYLWSLIAKTLFENWYFSMFLMK